MKGKALVSYLPKQIEPQGLAIREDFGPHDRISINSGSDEKTRIHYRPHHSSTHGHALERVDDRRPRHRTWLPKNRWRHPPKIQGKTMSLSNEWTEWHLTPRGWERGTEKEDGGLTRRPTPNDAVLSVKFHEYQAAMGAAMKKYHETEWTGSDAAAIIKLQKEFGPPPDHL